MNKGIDSYMLRNMESLREYGHPHHIIIIHNNRKFLYNYKTN